MKSLSEWESSYFGGFSKLLYDFPYIRKKIYPTYQQNTTKKNKLYTYSFEKLHSIFELSIKENKLVPNYLYDGEIVKLEGKSYYKVNNTQKEHIIHTLISLNLELSPLFEFYREELVESSIYYPMDDDGRAFSYFYSSSSSSSKVPEREYTSHEGYNRAMDYFEDLEKSDFGRYSSSILDNSDLIKKTKFKIEKKSLLPTKYNSEEKKNAKFLVNLLDINFSPKKDIVRNLKRGMITSHKIASVKAGYMKIYQRKEMNVSTRPFSVCILMDESGSMGSYDRRYEHYKEGGGKFNNYTHQHSLVKSLYLAFSEILPPDKLFIYGHTGLDSPDIYVYNDPYNKDFEYLIDGQKCRSCSQNYDGPVIDAIYNKVRSFTNDSILFLSISDGEPAGHQYGGSKDLEDMKRVIEKCRRDNFVTVGIGINYHRVKDIYSYSSIVRDMKDAPSIISNIINIAVKTEFKDQ